MNILAVLLAAVSSFLLGGLWYSPALFGKTWSSENGGEKQAGHPAKVFGINYQFAQRSFKLWLIDGGYHTAQFLIFGLVLGLWH